MATLSKAQFKLYRSLHIKKYRQKYQLFIAESAKLIHDFLQSGSEAECIIIPENTALPDELHNDKKIEVLECTTSEFAKLSQLSTPTNCIAIFKHFNHTLQKNKTGQSFSLVLDDIRNPGNMGTIIRIADWFGINQVICSHGCADIYNAKVVQASMGSLARVKITFTDLSDFFESIDHSIPVFGTYMEGESVYNIELPTHGFLVMGNEGKGISANLEKYMNQKISIPKFNPKNNPVESLNVGIATGILCAQFRKPLL